VQKQTTKLSDFRTTGIRRERHGSPCQSGDV